MIEFRNKSRGLLLALGLSLCGQLTQADSRQLELNQLPPEARQTLELIDRGGPFPYPGKDGSVFMNFEKQLPQKSRGYYREYTVPTPKAKNRGARRIITGGNPPAVYFYTPDHYRSFQPIRR